MTTEEIRNEQPHEEAQTQNTGGVTMGEQERQDQQGAGQNSEEKTRKPYDGSKAHGVNLDSMAEKALKRLELRFNYLTDKVKADSQVVADSEADEKKKNSAYAEILKNQKELDEILDAKSRIMAMNPVIKSEDEPDYKDFDPSILDKYKF